MNFTIDLFKWKAFKLPKVVFRKMGKHKVYGHYKVDNVIEIDDRLKGKKLMEIIIHEGGHWALPNLTEDEIRMLSRKFTELLWREGYRKADNED